MKITRITTSNFLGARAVDLELSKPVSLIAGKNGAGKSSIRDALALAFTADLCRVSLKKDAAALISEGGESCFVEVATSGDTYGVAITAAGKISDTMAGKETPAALPYVLDAQRFSRMPDNERRQFLFGLMGVKMDGQAIKQRLLAKGFDEKRVEQILPILRTGFDAASKEAASKARDAKASWKTATGGETWGKDKAAKWQPAPLPEGAENAAANHEAAKTHLQEVTGELDIAQQSLGAVKHSYNQQKEAEGKRAGLEAIAANVDRYTTKLNLDTVELQAWEEKVADCKARAGVAAPDPKAPGEFLLRGLAGVTREFLGLTVESQGLQGYKGDLYASWKQFEELINRAAKHLNEFTKLHGDPVGHGALPDPEAVAKLPEYENALRLMQSSVANGKRNLEAAQIAVEQLKVLDSMKESAGDTSEAEAKVAALNAKRSAAQAEVEKYRDIADKFAKRKTLIDQVKKMHTDVLAWTDIADALAPDGIPGDLLSEALGPINEHLRVSAADAEWEPAQINTDMSITYGLRDYALISESEKWRADAMIAEAVSHISGMRLLVLDRFDVLDLKGREDLMYWLDGMAEDGAIDTALIFGTLKSLPAQLLPSIDAFWIENGAAGKMKEAA